MKTLLIIGLCFLFLVEVSVLEHKEIEFVPTVGESISSSEKPRVIEINYDKEEVNLWLYGDSGSGIYNQRCCFLN